MGTFSFFSFGLKRFIEFFKLRNSFFLPINFCKEFDEEPILLNDYVLNTPYKGKNKMNNHLNLIFKFSQFSLSTIATFAFFFLLDHGVFSIMEVFLISYLVNF